MQVLAGLNKTTSHALGSNEKKTTVCNTIALQQSTSEMLAWSPFASFWALVEPTLQSSSPCCSHPPASKTHSTGTRHWSGFSETLSQSQTLPSQKDRPKSPWNHHWGWTKSQWRKQSRLRVHTWSTRQKDRKKKAESRFSSILNLKSFRVIVSVKSLQHNFSWCYFHLQHGNMVRFL